MFSDERLKAVALDVLLDDSFPVVFFYILYIIFCIIYKTFRTINAVLR